jgi:hypothetical protein
LTALALRSLQRNEIDIIIMKSVFSHPVIILTNTKGKVVLVKIISSGVWGEYDVRYCCWVRLLVKSV